MSSSAGAPPDPFDRDCNIEIRDAAKPIIRVHHSKFGATEFNPGFGGGRFHPIADQRGASIPTIYGANSIDGALSETVFHNVPASGPSKAIAQQSLLPMLSCTLKPLRPLRLIELRGFGLKKLGVTRAELIDTDADRYAVTRAWAAALYARVGDADGLIWTSRQHDASEAIVLFGTRVARDDLAVVAAPRSLYPPSPGWNDVLLAAEAAGITIVFG